jgi:anti-sigma B factor antagonist
VWYKEYLETKRRKCKMDIKVRKDGKEVVMTISGTIDIPGAENMKKTLSQISDEETGNITMDFKEVTSIGSSGIGALILFHKKFTSKGQGVKIININKEIRSLFKIIKLDTIFDI